MVNDSSQRCEIGGRVFRVEDLLTLLWHIVGLPLAQPPQVQPLVPRLVERQLLGVLRPCLQPPLCGEFEDLSSRILHLFYLANIP